MYSSQTPIDIHCGKLVDWLVQRRHCKRDWGENLSSIRRKIKSAIKDMPESDDIKKLLVGSKLDYFRSRSIVEILKTTEADSKNIFGYYSSQRMKDWQDIVYSYERDYIYLAEIATDLIRETNYEIPGIRRAIQRFHKDKDEAEKEKSNLLRRQQQFNSEYQKLAQIYGIKGVNVSDELKEESECLKQVMTELQILAKELKNGVEFYREYSKSISKIDSNNFLKALYHVIINGNTSVDEFMNANGSTDLEKSAPSSTSGGNPSEIELVNEEIDFVEDVPSSSESSNGFVHVGSKGDDTFVNVEQVARDPSDLNVDNNDSKLMLEDRRTRNQFLNNLYELDAFYKQLCNEEQTESASKIDKKDVVRILEITKKMIDIYCREKNRVLFQMIDNPSFIDNVNDKFKTKLKQASESSAKAELAQQKIEDLGNQIRDTEVHLKKSIQVAKQLQSKVEESISALYHGRQINIMGCVG